MKSLVRVSYMCKLMKHMDHQIKHKFDSEMQKGNSHIQTTTPTLNIKPSGLERKKI